MGDFVADNLVLIAAIGYALYSFWKAIAEKGKGKGEEGAIPSVPAEQAMNWEALQERLASGRVELDRVEESAVDHDLNTDAFAFHEAIEEPDEQEYHTRGFYAFHAADALTAPVMEEQGVTEGEADPLDGVDLRHWIVLNEILSPPLSQRHLRRR